MTMLTSSTDVRTSLEIIEVKPGLRFTKPVLKRLLPDVESALFFGKVYELDYRQLSVLLGLVLDSDVISALLNEGHSHSTELQHYIVRTVDDWGDPVATAAIQTGQITFGAAPPQGEILPELWKSLEIEVAQSIKDVANKMASVVGLMPGKQGAMIFGSLLKMNVRRPTLGDYRAQIHHAPVLDNLVILDVSASMSESTIRRIVDDVVALSYQANAHLAIVSNTTTVWEPGSYTSDNVLQAAEFSGTHYETLAPLFNRDWGVVVTVADYDSSQDAQWVIAQCTGRVDQLLDISLVNRPTFLAECVGQLATETRPLLIAPSAIVLSN